LAIVSKEENRLPLAVVHPLETGRDATNGMECWSTVGEMVAGALQNPRSVPDLNNEASASASNAITVSLGESSLVFLS
jgi:hypothetical protein